MEQLEYLGHIISQNGVATDPKKIEAMTMWPTPNTVKALRGFLGLTGYYRKFVRNYGVIARPLTELLKKDAFCWNEEAQSAFDTLKLAMTQAPVLALPDFTQIFVVETDASSKGIGAVLIQNKRPIAFLSKKLGPKNQLLSTYEKEFLALLTAITKWRHYLMGGRFVIKTDHISLKFLLEQKINTASQHKGLSKLLGLDYTIEYKKGSENIVADALSRQEGQSGICLVGAGNYFISELIPSWMKDIQNSYTTDEWIEGIKEKLKQPPDENTVIPYSQHQQLVRYKGRICIGNSGDWRQIILREMHASNVGGHSGVTATYHRLKRSFYWPNLKRDVHEFIKKCDVCQMNKPEHIHPPGLLQPLPTPRDAWVSVGLDFITGLPKSEGKEVIMVVVDRLTKYAHFIALAHPYKASDVAQCYFDFVYKYHGLPENIISDRDPIFTSRFWKELMTKLNVKLNLSTAYHPQTDGQTERVNQCLENYLRCMVFDKQKSWAKYLTMAEWWYNTSYHSAIKISPFEALFGYVPPQMGLGSAPRSQVAAVDTILRDRQAVLQQLKTNLAIAQNRMKQQADANRSERHFSVGDWVYLKLQPYRQITMSGLRNQKLSPKFYGPYEILRKIGACAYHLNLPAGSAIHPVFHVSQLKKRIGDTQATSPNLPVVGPNGIAQSVPVAILARRMVKKRNTADTEVLIQWSNQEIKEATWENYQSIAQRFPQFVLEVENALKEGGMSTTEANLGIIHPNFEAVKEKEGNPGREGKVEDTTGRKKLNEPGRCKWGPAPA